MVLATSQGRLSELMMDGAQPMSLEPLTPYHGLQLLRRLCGENRIVPDDEDAWRIVEYCGGLPVALHVAAVRLATHPRLTTKSLAAELADEHHRLQALHIGKERTVSAVLSITYDGLPAEAARLYRLLALHPGHRWDATSAAALTGTALAEVQEQLDRLERATLVTVMADGRYSFHDLVRLHALEKAIHTDSVPERTEAVRRVVNHLLARTVQANLSVMAPRMRIGTYVERLDGAERAPTFDNDQQALDWLDTWRGELLAAQHTAAEHGWHRLVWELAEALTALYINRRYVHDWVRSGELGAAHAAADGNPAAEARLRALLSRPLMDRDEPERARSELEIAITKADASGHALLRASVREFYGRYWDRCDPARAIVTYEEAMVFYRAAGDARGIAMGSYFMGCAEHALGRTEQALGTLRDAYNRFMTLGDRRMGARALAAVGNAKRSLGRNDEAVLLLEKAVDMLRERGALHYEAPARETLAAIAEERGDRALWRRHLTAALAIYEAYGLSRAEKLRRSLTHAAEEPEGAFGAGLRGRPGASETR
ncbi:hypothetical protein ACGH2B_22095 [Streptomyces sp. BBFR2]|uniref:hypothetical protein n=1 Tax=Streptomyces sp. BBFR2 TaxID=3372854 RepID=UPI0037D997E7